MSKLTRHVKNQIAASKERGESPNYSSWDRASGILLSRNEAEQLVKLADFFERLRTLSVERAEFGFKCYDNQPLTYWTTALAGEVGELCNMIKKMQRVELGGVDGGSSYSAKDITTEMLKEEIGGIAIYLDLIAARLGIDLREAITDTFNSKSEKYGWDYKI